MKTTKKPRLFTNNDTYPCPVCLRGTISPLLLMDAFSCDFCNHIFTPEFSTQRLLMADRDPPLAWYWNRQGWIGGHLIGVEFTWVYSLAAIAFVVFPTIIIGLAVYYFPPAPNAPFFWFPYIWTGLTFLSHLSIILWLMIEFYQFPVGRYLSIMRRYLW